MPQVIYPILERYGVKSGIEKIFTSPAPNLEDFPTMEKYQKRLLKD
jgi:hypothetical protein